MKSDDWVAGPLGSWLLRRERIPGLVRGFPKVVRVPFLGYLILGILLGSILGSYCLWKVPVWVALHMCGVQRRGTILGTEEVGLHRTPRRKGVHSFDHAESELAPSLPVLIEHQIPSTPIDPMPCGLGR